MCRSLLWSIQFTKSSRPMLVALTPNAVYLLTALLGACLGSFMNVVIHRLPLMGHVESGQVFDLNTPPSHCPRCQHQIRWYENIPVLSWLLLRGRCSSCKLAIPVRYPLVEIVAALGSVGVISAMGLSYLSAATAIVWLMCIPMFWWWCVDKERGQNRQMRTYGYVTATAIVMVAACWLLRCL